MSLKKNNTYFKENNGKIFYYDENGVRKDVPSTAFSDLQDQIDNLGSPLIYSGAQSVDELNNLTNIKQGTVYTVTGVSGTLTAGDVEVKQGDEIAWADPKWVEIGKDHDNSWKQWSEDRNNIFDDYSVYIGSDNNVSSNEWNNSFVIGDKNRAYNGSYAIGKNSFANEGSYAIGQNSKAEYGGLAISENIGSTAEYGSIAIGDGNVSASSGAISIGRNGVFAKNDSYSFGTLGSSAINHSFAIGSNLTSLDAGFAIGIAEDSNHGYNSKAEGGMILTMSNRSFKGGYHDESGNFIKEPWVDSTDLKTDISAKKYFDDEGNFVYRGITYTANNLWPAFAYNGGIAIGRAVSANRSIAISPKWNGYNSNNNGILGTSASNESVAIGDNVYATEGSLVFGKNGLSATMASIGIGRMGTATNASILISNDLAGNTYPFSGKMYCYLDSATNEYKPFTAYDSVVYKNTILNKQIYNTATNTFENIGNYTTATHLLFLNTWDGSIGWLTNGNYYSRSYFSGYYDENNNFIRVNSQSEVPSSATFIQVFSASAGTGTDFSYIKNNIFTMTLTGDYSYSSYSDNPGINRGFTVSGYYIDYYYDYDQSEWKYRLYESCQNRRNTSNSSLTSFLSQYKSLSSYINKNAYNGIVYDKVSYEDSTSSILNTTDNLVDYYVIGNQKIYPVEDSISGLTLQTITAMDEGKTWSTNDSISIGEGLSSYGRSIAINAGGDPGYGVNGSRNSSNIQSAKPGNLVTANNYSTEYTTNSFINNKITYRKNNIVTAYGKSIVLGVDGKNISAGGNSIAIGNHGIEVTGKSIGIGNNLYSLNQSIVINQNAFGKTPSAMNQSIVIGGNGSWAQGNSFIFGEVNSANNNAYVFGQGNSANGRTFAFGESNYIATGKSFALGYSNYINGSTEACTIGYRNYLNGGSMQHVVMGYDNYMSVGGYALHLIGNRNSASCGSVYGSVVGNWNMLNHGSSLLTIHGDNNSAFGSLGEANIFGAFNVVGGGGNRSTVLGFENGRNAPGSYGSYDGIVLGNRNNWCGNNFKTSIIGINNIISGINYSDMSLIGNDNFVSADEDGVILGNNNYINSYQYNNVNSTRNHIIGNNNTASGYASMNSILLGSFNRVFYGQNITIGEYNSASDQSYVIGTNNTANITGDNIGFGIHNKIGYEAISIGKNNISLGHSIIFGWNNTTEGNYIDENNNYAHTILIGNQNSTKNTQQYIHQKSYPYIKQKILSESEINQIQTEITELQEQRTTAYQNSANKANEIYSLLTANGLNSVSAENYINGTLYNSGYGHEYIYPYTPWAIQNYPYGISYKENGTWYTGYGESAYVKRWIYNTSSYSSYDTSDYSYKYYWLPAKQASATWSIVSSIYTAQYGSDSANRYNAINTAIQHINDLSQSIYTKQNELTQNPITASGTTDSHNIETMSFVVGQSNSADHHNSIVIGSENHTLKMVNTNYSDDDGFTVAIGVGNTVVRNYDMAFGYGSVASGGENIAIGTPQYSNITNTEAIGCKNISIRSKVCGVNNFASNSLIVNSDSDTYDDNNLRKYTNNLIFNTKISGINEVNDNFIFGCQAYNTSDNYGISGLKNSNFNAIFASRDLIDVSANYSLLFGNTYYNPCYISSTQINRSLVGFGTNSAMSARINESIFGWNSSAISSEINTSLVMNSLTNNRIDNSIILGTSANKVASIISISDDIKYTYNKPQLISNQAFGVFIGQGIEAVGLDNYSVFNHVMGDTNILVDGYGDNSIVGNNNKIYRSMYTTITGASNTLFPVNDYNSYYNLIHGEKNNNYNYNNAYTKIFGAENNIGNTDLKNIITNNSYYSKSQFDSNTTTNKVVYKNYKTTETLKSKQKLYSNTPYIFNEDSEHINGKWNTIDDSTNYHGGLWQDYEIQEHRFCIAPSKLTYDFYRLLSYLSNWNYYSYHKLYDYITIEDYNNLPSTAKSKYSYLGSISGKELGYHTYYYRVIDWKNENYQDYVYNVHVIDYVDDIPVRMGEAPYYYSLISHIEEIKKTDLTQVSTQEFMDTINPGDGTLIYTTDTVEAKKRIVNSFGGYRFLKSDDTYPDVWSSYDLPSNMHNYASYFVLEGQQNTVESSNVYYSRIFGNNNNITNSTSNYGFIFGMQNTITGKNNAYNVLIGVNNTAASIDNKCTFGFTYGQNNYINGPQVLSIGSNNTAHGALATVFGETNAASEHQFIIGKYNDLSYPSANRGKYVYNYDTSACEIPENSGILFAIGNGYVNGYELTSKVGDQYTGWYDVNNQSIDETNSDNIVRSNAMIVSADGTVSARRFIESEPALTITGGDYVSVTEDTTNNKLVIDLESSLGQMLTELSGVLTAKPSTGRHILGVDGGTLTWLEVNQ